MTNKEYEYFGNTRSGAITPFTIYANIIEESEDFVTIERAQGYGKIPISNATMTKGAFYESYDNVNFIRPYKGEYGSGIEIDIRVDGQKMTVVFQTESDINATVPTYFFKNAKYPIEPAFQAKVETKVFDMVIDYHHPLITDDIKKFAKDVLETGKEILDLAQKNKEFYYPTPFEDIKIEPCIGWDGVLECFSVTSDIFHSNPTVFYNTAFSIAENIVNCENIFKAREQSKDDLQRFYKEKIKVLKGRNNLNKEELSYLDTFSYWHRQVYGYEPRGDQNECEKTKTHKTSLENTSRDS